MLGLGVGLGGLLAKRSLGAFAVNPNLRLEGDSMMEAGSGAGTELAALLPELDIQNTAVGGSTATAQTGRILDEANASLLDRITIWYDGGYNGGELAPAAYVDMIATGLAALPHQQFLVIPPVNKQSDGGDSNNATNVQIRDLMLARWGAARVLDWRDLLDHTDGDIADNIYSDDIHFTTLGKALIAKGIADRLMANGWLPSKADLMLSSGSLFLFDPSNIAGAFSGVPNNNDILPNIAWEEAASIVGSGDATTLGAHFGDAQNDGSVALIERTSKGGIHAMLSQANTSWTGLAGCAIWPNSAIQDYINNNINDNFYISMWVMPTRLGAPAYDVFPPYIVKAANTSNFLIYLRHTSGTVWVNGDNNIQLPDNNIHSTDNVPYLIGGRTDGVVGDLSSVSAADLNFNMGNMSGTWSGFADQGRACSGVIYRATVENLTQSGRSFAEVSAIDKMLHDIAFSNVGAFGGDSYSDPAVALP